MKQKHIYINQVKYHEGDSFFMPNGKEIVVKKIIDEVHFITGDGHSWHTQMFYDQNCHHSPEKQKEYDRRQNALEM